MPTLRHLSKGAFLIITPRTKAQNDTWSPQLSMGSYTRKNWSQGLPEAETVARILGKDLRMKSEVEIIKAVVLNWGWFASPENTRQFLKTSAVPQLEERALLLPMGRSWECWEIPYNAQDSLPPQRVIQSKIVQNVETGKHIYLDGIYFVCSLLHSKTKHWLAQRKSKIKM